MFQYILDHPNEYGHIKPKRNTIYFASIINCKKFGLLHPHKGTTSTTTK
jgi:hypothetical protein